MTMKTLSALMLSLVVGLAAHARAADEAADGAETYLLRYKFQPGEAVRWKVEHRARVKTTVSGTTQTADTTSVSVKRWQVTDADSEGDISFVHWVDSVSMRQQLTGREEEFFDSTADEKAPPGYEDVAKAIGVPLTVVTMDASGEIIQREEKLQQPNANSGQMTIPLPTEPIAVGHAWFYPYEVDAPLPTGVVKKIKARQQFRLRDVTEGVATIEVSTQVLTPVNDPAVEVQLIQKEVNGTVRFDIERGRVVQQQTDVDRHVVGFSGDASSMHYTTRFTEELLPETPAAARRAIRNRAR